MTEEEWLICEDPDSMLRYVHGKTSDRKLRLFAVALCRRFEHMLIDETRQALDVAEQFADGLVNQNERKEARERAFHAGWNQDQSLQHRRGPAKACVTATLARSAMEAASSVSHYTLQIGRLTHLVISDGQRATQSDWQIAEQKEKIAQANVLREIFGYLHVKDTRDWQSSDVTQMARTIYDNRRYDLLPILADALMDAGCTEDRIINHCRNQDVHYRGCWVIDLILGQN